MRFFHVSDNHNLSGKEISPQIPINRMNSEENTIPRICVSTSINGCLTGAIRYKKGDTLTIYSCETDDFYQPSIKEVIDSPLTGEIWILNPVKFEFFTKVIITNVFENKFEGLENNFHSFNRIEKDNK